MTRRDRGSRTLGVLLVASGYGAGFAIRPLEAGTGTALTLLCFLATLSGLVLAVQGKRVLQVFRIEQSRHRKLPLILHLRRRR